MRITEAATVEARRTLRRIKDKLGSGKLDPINAALALQLLEDSVNTYAPSLTVILGAYRTVDDYLQELDQVRCHLDSEVAAILSRYKQDISSEYIELAFVIRSARELGFRERWERHEILQRAYQEYRLCWPEYEIYSLNRELLFGLCLAYAHQGAPEPLVVPFHHVRDAHGNDHHFLIARENDGFRIQSHSANRGLRDSPDTRYALRVVV